MANDSQLFLHSLNTLAIGFTMLDEVVVEGSELKNLGLTRKKPQRRVSPRLLHALKPCDSPSSL